MFHPTGAGQKQLAALRLWSWCSLMCCKLGCKGISVRERLFLEASCWRIAIQSMIHAILRQKHLLRTVKAFGHQKYSICGIASHQLVGIVFMHCLAESPQQQIAVQLFPGWLSLLEGGTCRRKARRSIQPMTTLTWIFGLGTHLSVSFFVGTPFGGCQETKSHLPKSPQFHVWLPFN